MDSHLTAMIQESLDRLLTERYGPKQREAAVNTYGRDKALWLAFADLGLLAVADTPERGGLDGDLNAVVALMEVAGRHLLIEPFFATAIICGSLARLGGRFEILSQIASGDMTVALAWGSGFAQADRLRPSCNASRSENGWTIEGGARFVRGAPGASHVLIAAGGDTDEAIAFFLLPLDHAALSQDKYRLLDGAHASDICVDNAKVGEESFLGSLLIGSSALDALCGLVQIGICAEAVGIFKELVTRTATYIGQREQFGQPLSAFQAVRHRLSDMISELEMAESMVAMVIGTQVGREQVSAMKYRVGQASRIICHGAIQLHGGVGITDELIISHYVRRAMVIEREFGSADQYIACFESIHFPRAA